MLRETVPRETERSVAERWEGVGLEKIAEIAALYFDFVVGLISVNDDIQISCDEHVAAAVRD